MRQPLSDFFSLLPTNQAPGTGENSKDAQGKQKLQTVQQSRMFMTIFRRVLIRQHKAQMKRKSKEIQEALVRNDCMRVIIRPQCVHDTDPMTLLRSVFKEARSRNFRQF